MSKFKLIDRAVSIGCAELSADEADALQKELAHEMPPGHMLEGLQLPSQEAWQERRGRP